MFKGTIYITEDINLCLANLGKCKSIIIADTPDNWYKIPDRIGGSLLLPPYEAFSAIIDDDDEKFRYIYLDYLNTDISVNKFINIILQALIAGTNILLFIEPDSPADYSSILKEYFMINFGIRIGDMNTTFAYDISFIPTILNRLYLEDDFSKELFLKLYPVNTTFNVYVLKKLIYEYGLVFNNDIEAIMYFNKISKVLKNNGLVKDVVKRL